MKSGSILAATAALALFAFGCAGSGIEQAVPLGDSDSAANPFFAESTLPFGLPPYDRIDNAHYRPAFERGMADQLVEIDAIANALDAPTFENTIVAMERSGRLLTRVANVFFALSSADTNDVIDEVETEVAPKLAAHNDQILLNAELFARVETLHDERDALGLDAESRRLLEEYYTDFVRAGAELSEPEKERLKAINAELATLRTSFSQNVLKAVNAASVIVDTREELAGLSESAIAVAAEAATARDLEGTFVIPLLNTSGQPALASLENRALRERIMVASLARGSQGTEFDNRGNVTRMARLRAERAAMLGYPTHAVYVLEQQTAETVEAVTERLASLTPPAVANARREAADLQEMIAAEGADFELAAWDWSYYSAKVRAAQYAFDESQLRSYFELNTVLTNGVFYAATELYGLTFEERLELPVYHPDVRVFEVRDADGSPLGLFLADFYARPSKRGGAWMNASVSQSQLLGTQAVIANHLNIPKPPVGEPTLLTFDEVTTMFHEFGHALHGAVLGCSLSVLRRDVGAARLRRVPVAGERNVGHLAGGAETLRRPPRDRRADADRAPRQSAGDGDLQSGLRHHRVSGGLAPRHGLASADGRRGSGCGRSDRLRGGGTRGGRRGARGRPATVSKHLLPAHLHQ